MTDKKPECMTDNAPEHTLDRMPESIDSRSDFESRFVLRRSDLLSIHEFGLVDLSFVPCPSLSCMSRSSTIRGIILGSGTPFFCHIYVRFMGPFELEGFPAGITVSSCWIL